MSKLYVTMKSNVGSNIQDTSSEMQSLIGRYLNDRLKEVLQRLNILDSTRLDYQFSTTAGTEDYVMPADFGKPLKVYDLTNGCELTQISQQEWVDKYVATINTQGDVQKYFVTNSPVQKQPSSAGTFSVVSSDSGDGAAKVYAKFLDANNQIDYEELTLNGTTTVTSTKSASRFLGLAKNEDTAGYITVTRGSDTVAVLSREDRETRYKVMRLISIPNSAITVEVVYLQGFIPLENDYDSPTIDCGDAIEAGATADAWRFKRQFAKAQDMENLFEKRLLNFAYDHENQPNLVHKLNPKPYNRNYV